MRVMVFPVRDGVREILVVPRRGTKLAPVSVRGTARADVLAEVEAVVAAVGEAEKDRVVERPA